jgi:hypothetical protein
LAVLFTPELLAAWQAEGEVALTKFARPNGLGEGDKALQLSEQFMIVITCRDRNSKWSCWAGFRARGWSARRWWGKAKL